ncbi:stonin-1-like isoform X2 [Oscarella lobularis]|uniref:stonin-1-like isoform X2 n=1 Tax=Oscarella lobularis TaxID=121494 RepID=UPI0033136FE3
MESRTSDAFNPFSDDFSRFDAEMISKVVAQSSDAVASTASTSNAANGALLNASSFARSSQTNWVTFDDDDPKDSLTAAVTSENKVNWALTSETPTLAARESVQDREFEWKVYCKLRRSKKSDPWVPVYMTLHESTLTLKRCSEDRLLAAATKTPTTAETKETKETNGMEEISLNDDDDVDDDPDNDILPYHEIELVHEMAFTPIIVRKTTKKWKCHSVKLRYNEYEEKRSLFALFQRDHVKKSTTLLKLVHDDPFLLRRLVDSVSTTIRELPAVVKESTTSVYRINEIFVEFHENCDVEARWNGKPISQGGVDRVRVRAFLSLSPDCRLILNDREADEIQSASGFLPPGRAVFLRDVVLHPCCDRDAFYSHRIVRFRPLNAVNFDLMQFRTKPLCPPPLVARVQMKMDKFAVTLTVVLEKGKTISHALHFSNVVLKFPVPSAWACLFVKATRLGKKKSVKSYRRMGIRLSLASDSCQIQANVGRAKYEPEFGALAWRIGSLPGGPVLETKDRPTMSCQLQLHQGIYIGRI